MNDPLHYNFLQIAREHAMIDSYKEAFKYYLKAMQSYPRVRKLIEFEFRVVLINYNAHLRGEGNKPEMLANFQTAMRVYPGNVNLLSDIGKYLYQHSYFCEALLHFERALQIDSSLVSIEKCMDTAKKILFPRANFRLLNDKRRNRAYMEAIRAVVMPNAECVLDIDTGTGLSALYANACAAASTAACDPSHSMTMLAERIMTDNDVQKILVINKSATKLDLNDVYGERTMLITNKFDSGLIGDQLLLTLKHSWENLLTEYGRVIPGRAKYYVVGAKCDRVKLKYHLGPAAKKLLKVPDLNVHTERADDETYYGEDISLYDDIEYVTDAQMLFSINFNDYYDITRMLKNVNPNIAHLTAEKNTEVNVLVGWFKLYLTDDIVLTTDPRSPDKSGAWQQAVFFDFIPTQLKANETICVQFDTHGGKLKYIPDSNKDVMRLSAAALAFLNDTEYMNVIEASVKVATIYLGQITDVSDFVIADLCPFPLFGMLMMKRGARSIMCIARHASDKVFMEHVFRQHNIPLDNVTILVADYWNHTIFTDQMYHAIFCNALDLNGDIETRLNRITQHLQYSHLVSGGLMMPAKISLIGQLISSEWLDEQNRMSDESVFSFKMRAQVNLFQASQASCIDPSRLRYVPLSEPAVLAECCLKMKSQASSVRVTRDGVCSGVLCWYEARLLAHDAGLTTCRSSGFVDSAAFLARPRLDLFRGDSVSVIRCVDCDGSYKVVLDLDVV